jgi:hypothetical protein
MAEGTRMQQRRATEAVWSTSGYVLADGELGITTDSGIIKIGDGVNAWSDLDPAFDSHYLPILGKAADSELLDGIGSEGFWKTDDATTAPTSSKLALRTGTGTVKGAVAAASDDLVAKSQLDSTNAAVATNTTDISNLKLHTVADRTALLALSTGSFPYGYLVKQTDTGYIWMWDLTAWRYVGNPGGDHPYIIISRSTLTWGNTDGHVYGYGLDTNSDDDLFSYTPGTSTAAPGFVTVTDAGKYKITSFLAADLGGAYYAFLQSVFPGISTSLFLGKFTSALGMAVPNGFSDLIVYDEGYLPANQNIRQRVYMNTAGATIRSSYIVVMRVPSI